MKRSAAITADFLRRVLHAEPVAARGTFWSQTLHRPAGQILHPFASQSAEFLEVEIRPVKQAGLCAGESSVSSQKATISRGTVPSWNRRYLTRNFAAVI